MKTGTAVKEVRVILDCMDGYPIFPLGLSHSPTPKNNPTARINDYIETLNKMTHFNMLILDSDSAAHGLIRLVHRGTWLGRGKQHVLL